MNNGTAQLPVLLGPDGRPVEAPSRMNDREAVIRTWNAFRSALSNVNAPPDLRARDPFKNHVWVYAAIMAISSNISQVPFCVYREDPDDPATQRRLKAGIRPKRGRNRTASDRFLKQASRGQGFKVRGAYKDYDSDWAALFRRPNPFQSMSQFLETFAMWMSLRGACFVLCLNENRDPVSLGERPDSLWPVCPDFFSPIQDGDDFAGWRFALPKGHPAAMRGWFEVLMPWQVLAARYTDPSDPLGWCSPITAAAAGITTDMSGIAYNRSVLKNGSRPGGIIMTEDSLDPEDQQRLNEYWSSGFK